MFPLASDGGTFSRDRYSARGYSMEMGHAETKATWTKKQLGPKATWTKSNLDRCPPAMLKIDLERAMEHRRFLEQPETHHPFAGGNLLGRIGGEAAIAALIEALYDRIETDPLLQPLFNRDLTNEREAQKRFFAEWLGGGDTAYSDRAHLPLAHRHDLLPIT